MRVPERRESLRGEGYGIAIHNNMARIFTANRPHPDGGLPCWARNARDPEHASGVNMTYKVLFNDAVAMTGGQHVDGTLTVPDIAHQVRRDQR